LESGKIYKFSVQNLTLRNLWVDALKSEVEKAKNYTENEEITQFKVSTIFEFKNSSF